MTVAVLFDRYGPYHVAKLSAAYAFVSIIPIELFGKSSEYKWNKVKGLANRLTLFPEKSKETVSFYQLCSAVHRTLNLHKPDAVAINGWSDKGALSALYWCLKNGVPAILMSDSTAIDEKRVWWKEFIKKCIVRNCASGLVAGSRHVHYLNQLGMPADAIYTGYDVIDNQYFKNKVAHIRVHESTARERIGLPDKYFLASSRFVPKKNLHLLISTYANYRKLAKQPLYDLVIVGDGALRTDLVTLINYLGLQQTVHLPGFKQYNDLPYYYAFASAFIHASTSEQWGLVVNEAMASGLPVIVSERCGCVPELVQNGINGYAFDPFNEQALLNILLTLSANKHNLEEMAANSLAIIERWNLDRFGKGLRSAAEEATAVSAKNASFFDKVVIRSLLLR